MPGTIHRNKWILFDDLYETGPIAKNLVLAPIPRSIFNSGDLKIKIELTKGLWRIDYLGLTSINSKADPVTIYPNSIEVVNGENYTVARSPPMMTPIWCPSPEMNLNLNSTYRNNPKKRNMNFFCLPKATI